MSAGGRDKTVRYWKVPEETQLVFRGGGGSRWHDDLDGMDEEDNVAKGGKKGDGAKAEKFVEGSIECVAMIDETTFVSGGDSGYVPCLLFLPAPLYPVPLGCLGAGVDVDFAFIGLSVYGTPSEKSLCLLRRLRTASISRKRTPQMSERYTNRAG